MCRHTNSLSRFAIAVALLTLTATLAAADELYLRAVGTVQGNIQGTATRQGHENWIESLAFSHGVSVPIGTDGLPSGPALTSPLTMMTSFDRSTIKLLTAQVTNEVFSELKLEWVDDASGATLFRYSLVNGRLADAQESGSSGGGDAPIMSLSFVYSRIDITNVVLGTTVSYDWHSASSSTPETLAKGILLSPAPNPTHGRTEFRFSLPADSNAQLALYDLRGHLVRNLHSGWTSAEPTVAVWDGTDDRGRRVAQGMYVARLTYPGREVTQRLTVLR